MVLGGKKPENKFLVMIKDFYNSLFGGVADAIINLADIEKNYPKEYKIIRDFSNDPEKIDEIVEKLSNEERLQLLTLMLKANSFSRKISKMFDLTEKDKRKLGKELKEFSKEITEAGN